MNGQKPLLFQNYYQFLQYSLVQKASVWVPLASFLSGACLLLLVGLVADDLSKSQYKIKLFHL